MRRVVALVAAAVLVAGCGLPDDDRPRLIADADAPIDLAPTTTPQDPMPDDAENQVNVFFVNGEGRLQAVRRPVEEDTVDERIRALLRGLVEGDPNGLVTRIPGTTELIDTTTEGDVLVVNLGPAGEGGIQSVQGPAEIQAFAQLVRTATTFSGVRALRFLVDGTPISAITGSGQETQEPVSRDDYEQLAPG